MRSDLSAAEEAAHLKRRKKIWIQKESGSDRATLTGRGNKGFAANTAETTGQPKSSVNRKIARADKVVVLNDVKGTSLDKGTKLETFIVNESGPNNPMSRKYSRLLPNWQ